jgi:hypothetical protein
LVLDWLEKLENEKTIPDSLDPIHAHAGSGQLAEWRRAAAYSPNGLT